MQVLTGAAAEEMIADHMALESSQESVIVEDAPITGGADILALFGDGEEAAAHYVEVALPIKGRMVEMQIKRLSNKEEAALDAKIDRKNGMAVTVQDDEAANINAAALLMVETVYSKTGENSYQKFFTLEQLLGRREIKQGNLIKQRKKAGLFDQGDPEAKEWCEAIAGFCYELHPALMPALKKMVEKAMRARVGLD